MRRWPCIAAAPGAAFVLVDTALAVALGNSSVFVPLLVIGPLVAAALASPRCTLGVALLAVACALRFAREAHAPVFAGARWPALIAHSDRCEALDVFRSVVQPFSPPKKN